MERKEWLNKNEVCKLLGISQTTLYRYIKTGLFKVYKYGVKNSKIHFKRCDIIEFLETHKSGEANNDNY